MQTPSPFFIAASILSAPAWVRLGIAVPDQRMRERAARELAGVIVDRLDEPPMIADADQMALPL